jgi:hypothetical protein
LVDMSHWELENLADLEKVMNRMEQQRVQHDNRISVYELYSPWHIFDEYMELRDVNQA